MYLEKLSMAGKRVVVAGGGRGMGYAISQAVVEAGGQVAIVDIDASKATEVADDLGRDKAIPLSFDLRDPDRVTDMVNEVRRQWGGFEAMVTVIGGMQGVFRWTTVHETEPHEWDAVTDLNLRHVYLLARAAVDHWIQQEVPGVFLSITSVSALHAAPNHGAYGAAKAGLMSLTRTLAAEYGKHGIRANNIAPGAIHTERSGEAYSPEELRKVNALVPLGRLGAIEDIAGVGLFLLSDLSAYVTGLTLPVDGGISEIYPFATERSIK